MNKEMINRLLLRAVALLLLTTGLALPALSQQSQEEQEIQQMLEARDQQIKDILGEGEPTGEERAELQTLINDVIDFREMGRQALGPHWDDLSPEEQEEFIEAFADVVRAQSLEDLSVYRAEVSYGTIEVEGDSAYVETTALVDGSPVPVEYHMGRDEADWHVHDIVLDGVSTVEGYERSFQRVIVRRGFDALMETLDRRREEAAQGG